MDLNNMPILNSLETYRKDNVKRFHMPGHFGKSNYEPMMKLCEHMFEYDVTEVYGTDNLFCPEGVIKEALDKLSDAYCSEKSFFLVNGSTSGIYSMVEATTHYGDKIIVGRNCHKSIFNIAKLKSLRLEYIYPQIDENTGIDMGYTLDSIREVVEKNKEAKALLLPYPNYWGSCYELREISEFIHSKNMLLLIDEAHGAHLNYSEKLPKSSLELGADIVVQSTHKMLPALTQTAILHCRKNLNLEVLEAVNEAVKIFNTSSPSYLFMASIDISRAYMQEHGKMVLDKLFHNVNIIRADYINNKFLQIIPTEDYCKLVIRTKCKGNKVDEALRYKYKIQSEMVLGNNILFMLGVDRALEDLIYIIESIITIVKGIDRAEMEISNNTYFPRLEKAMEVYEVKRDKLVKVHIDKAVGKISGDRIIPFPPGIPLVLEGEIINREVVNVIKSIKLLSEVMVYE